MPKNFLSPAICVIMLSYIAKAQPSLSDSAALKYYNNQVQKAMFTNSDSARYWAERGLNKFTATNYQDGAAKMMSILADINKEQGRYEEAKLEGLYALDLYRKRGDLKQALAMLNHMGTVEQLLHRSSAAEEYFNAALELHDTIPSDYNGLMLTYFNLGKLYTQNESTLQDAWKCFAHAESAAAMIPANDSVISLYNNIANLYKNNGQSEMARRYLQRSIDMSADYKLAHSYARSMYMMGILYEDEGDAGKAVTYWNKAMQAASEQKMYGLQINILLHAAQTLKPEYINEYIDRAMSINDHLKNPVVQARYYGEIARLYERQGQYMDALYAARKQERILDSIDRINQDHEFRNKNIVTQLERSNIRVKELQSLTRKNSIQNLVIIIFSISTFAGFVIVILQYTKTSRLNRRMALHERELASLNMTKNKLFSIIGHDLRAPLAKIYTVLELYEQDIFDEEEKKEIIEDLKDHTKATTDTLDKLLYWGKSLIQGEELQQQPVATTEIIDQNIKLKKSAAADKRITVDNHTPKDLYIFADRYHFDFIIRNLLANAIKFTFAGGQIDIRCQDVEHTDMIIFSVADTGKGMTPKQLKQLFEPFNTTDGTDSEKGTGIGLMLCKEFAIKNGGDLWAESPGERLGSTFFFSLKKNNIPL